MKLAAVLLCIFLAFASASAKELEKRVTYDGINLLRPEMRSMEIWTMQAKEEKKQVWYELTKDSFVRATARRRTETHKRGITEFREEDGEVYQKQVLPQDPFQMHLGQRNTGYVEVRSIKDDHVLSTWPVSYALERVSGAWRITFETYLPQGHVRKVVSVYPAPTAYPFPEHETRTITREGKVLTHIEYRRRWK
jgi:hypothetical protein